MKLRWRLTSSDGEYRSYVCAQDERLFITGHPSQLILYKTGLGHITRLTTGGLMKCKTAAQELVNSENPLHDVIGLVEECCSGKE